MKALGLPALGGLVGSAPNTASGFAPVRRKKPANTEPIAPFRIVLRDRTLKPVNYNVDRFDPEDDVEEGRDRKRSRRADPTRATECARQLPLPARRAARCHPRDTGAGGRGGTNYCCRAWYSGHANGGV